MSRTVQYKNAKLVNVLISTFLLFAVAIAPLKASAWTGFYFNGAWKTVSNNGAALTIETQNPTISEDSSVSAWAMTCNGTDSYAQVGWVKFSGYTAPKYFYEYNYEPGGVWYQKTLGTATAGSHNDFMVGCDSTTMYFKINGISYGTVSLSTIPFTRSMVQFFGETHDEDDQCPGSVANPVTMGNAKYKNTSNSWVSATCYNPSSLGSGYGDLSTMRNNISTSGSTEWEIWDSRY
jgi:hypothetical protein